VGVGARKSMVDFGGRVLRSAAMRAIGILATTASVGGLVTLLVACGPGVKKADDDDDDPDPPPVDSNTNTNTNTNSDGCSDAAKLVYVFDSNEKLSTFDPATKTFKDLGTLNCPASFGFAPFSMGVDRTPTAWVLYSSGFSAQLFRVDPMTLKCEKTSWTTKLELRMFGMGFSTDAAGGTTDTLYIAGGADPLGDASKLAQLNTTSMNPTMIGNLQGWPEMTGTGKAELWGFFPDGGTPRIQQLSKTNGMGLTTFPLPSLADGGGIGDAAFAFAFWGGDFWIFLRKLSDSSTKVYQVDGTTGAIKGTTPPTGREIVGAGVSTCAPIVIL
jgi:hypothetical protein